MTATTAILAVLSLTVPATAHATTALPRISGGDCRYVVHETLGQTAQLLNEKLTSTRCRPVGRRSRGCVVRVGSERFYVTTRYLNADLEVYGAARRLSATGGVR